MTKLEMMQLSQGLSDLYTGLETDLIANIADYLKKGDVSSSTAQWKMQMLAQLGALDKANLKTIAEYAGIAPEMLTEVLESAALTAIEELEPGFRELARDGIAKDTDVPIEETMERALKTYRKQARSDMNLVNTVMLYKAKSTAQKVINNTAELADKQSFLNMLNKAAGKAVTGAESRQAAMRQCIKEMSDKGIPAFVDKLGREWSPEAYINMNIRTTVANTAHQAQFDRMDDYDLNLVEVSSHAGARPKCAKDQGKIFNRSGKGGYTEDMNGKKIRYYAWSSSSYGEPDGLLGINCGHQIYPFVPGVSRQTYFPYDKKENDELYRKMQRQRELERRVRKSKRECMTLEKLGDTEGLTKASATLKQRQAALKQYCSDNGLSYKSDRTAVVNYKNSVAGFTTSDKKKRIAEIQAKTVDKSGESGIIKESSTDYHYLSNDEFEQLGDWKISEEDISQTSGHKVYDENGNYIDEGGYIRTANSRSINRALRTGDLSRLNSDDLLTIQALENVISSNKSKRDILLDRYVNPNYLRQHFGLELKRFDKASTIDCADSIADKFVGTTIEEKGFVSCSWNPKMNMFKSSCPVKLEISVPKGSHMYATNNSDESEIILNRGSKFKVNGCVADINEDGDRILKLLIELIQ